VASRRLVCVALVGCASLAGCGGGSSKPGSARASAQQFVAAVTRDDRATWCGEIGAALLAPGKSGAIAGQLLSQCKSSDLFAITASCDREAVISGTSVTGDNVHGDSADVSLSSRAKLGLHRSQGAWYITSISGGTPQQIKQGPCAGAGS
jgi:hypothetical protein